MRVHNLLALAAACLLAGTASASTILISSDAANIGNGQLQVSGQAANAADAVTAGQLINLGANPGGFSTNAFGRLLISADSEDFVSGTSTLADILDNGGVVTDGFTVFRAGDIPSGNAAFGFLESGGDLGSPNTANNGLAFANQGGIFLLSDTFNVPLAATDTVSIEFLAGSDSGANNTTVETFLVVDGVLNSVNTTTIVGNPSAAGGISIDLDVTGFSGSSFALGIFAESGLGGIQRPQLDNINLSVIPEPNAVALSLLALSSLGAVGMRARLG